MFLKKTSAFLLVITAFLAIQSSFAFAQALGNSVDLLVEPLGYIPPFYKGKPFFSNQGSVKILALTNISANGQTTSQKDLSFKWSTNGTVLGQNSGLGKDNLVLDGGFPAKNISVNVEVSDSAGNIVAQNSKIIRVQNPKILFYELSPPYGVLWNRALNRGYNLGDREEIRIVAKPFSFSASDDLSADLDYSWLINGSAVNIPGKKNQLLLRQTNPGGSGVTSVKAEIKNNSRIFQFTSDNFNISYGGQ